MDKLLSLVSLLLVASVDGHQAIEAPTSAPTDPSLEVASDTFEKGHTHYKAGRIEQAIPHYEHAAATLMSMLGESHIVTKAMVDRLAVVRQSTPGHWLECGSEAERPNCQGRVVADDTSLHEVRCCSDSKLSSNWINHDNCEVWAETFTHFRIEQICADGLNFANAKNLCESQGARLCTRREVYTGCTRGSGCGNDRHLYWTSGAGPVQNNVNSGSPTAAPTAGGNLASYLTTSTASNGFDENKRITRWMMSAQYHGRAENWDEHTTGSCGFSSPELVAHSHIDADKFASSDLSTVEMEHFLDPSTGWRQYHFNKAETDDFGQFLSGCGGECNAGNGVDMGTHFNCQGLMSTPGATSCCSTAYAEHKFAYAVTYIWADAAITTTFRVGSDDGIVVWLNSQELTWNQVPADMACHCYGDSKYSAPLNFNQGWNRLMVKVSQRSGEWGFNSKFDSTTGLRIFKDTVYPFNAASSTHDEL